MKPILANARRSLLFLAPVVLLLSACLSASTEVSLKTDGVSGKGGTISAEAVREERGSLKAGLKRVIVRHKLGDLTITSAKGTKPGWFWSLRSSAAARERAAEIIRDEVRLAFEENGTSLTIRLDLPAEATRAGSLRSSLTLKLPGSVAVDVENCFGTTRVSGLDGAVKVASSHGAIELTRLAGPVEARAEHSRILARKLGGKAELRNAHGAINVSGVAGALTAETNHSSLRVSDVKGGARLKNSHGAIRAAAVAGLVEAEAIHGSVSIEGASSREIIARVAHGGIALSIGEETRRVEAATSFGELELRGLGGRPCRLRAATSFGVITAPPGLVVTGDQYSQKCQGNPVKPPTLSITLENVNGSIQIK